MNSVFFAMPKTASGILAHKLGKAGVQYIGHCNIDNSHREIKEQLDKGVSVFCFVRHPISRLISAYDFILAGGIKKGIDVEMTKILNKYESFNDFCLDIDSATKNKYSVHFYPQSRWIGKDVVVYKYESLSNDAIDAGERFGFKIDFSDKPYTESRSARKPDYNRFSKEALDSVIEYYKEDFNRFGYNPMGGVL